MTVTLINVSGRLKCFTLPHESYCAARGRCACRQTPGRDGRRVPSSLTLAHDSKAEGLDDAVLAVDEIGRALRNGDLRAERKAQPSSRPLTSPDSGSRRTGKKLRGDA